MQKLPPILWQPLFVAGGHAGGVALEPTFVQLCKQIPMTPKLSERLSAYVWKLTKPDSWDKGYIPSEIFTFVDDTLLINAVYKRHDGASGKWLYADDFGLSRVEQGGAVKYSYHHCRDLLDHRDNRWLMFAFHYWVRFAVMQLEKHNLVEEFELL